MIRLILVVSWLTLCAPVCFGQTDSTRSSQDSPRSPASIPGIDTPMSGPGTLLQSSPGPNPVVAPERKGGKRRRTNAPSNPRAFGVGIPLGGAKKDTLNR